MPDELITRPTFLPTPTEFDGNVEGLEEAGDIQLLNYFNVRADMAKGELKEKFDPGDLVLTPSMELVAKKGELIHIVPIHFYKYAAHQNPYGASKFIIEKTRDQNSTVWKLAASDNRDDWVGPPSTEVQGKNTEYVMHLCYVCIVDQPGKPGHGESTILDFSKGEWKWGAMFKKRITARCFEYKLKQMFANRFAISVEEHSNPQHTWWGISSHEPIDGKLFVNEQQFKLFSDAKIQIVQSLQAGDLQYAQENPETTIDPANVDERF